MEIKHVLFKSCRQDSSSFSSTKKCNILVTQSWRINMFPNFCWKRNQNWAPPSFFRLRAKIETTLLSRNISSFWFIFERCSCFLSWGDERGQKRAPWKNVLNTSRRHCEAWALKVVNVLRCCLHCSLCFCFFVLLQVFAGATFFLCLGDQRGSEKGTLSKCSKYMKKAWQGMSSKGGKCWSDVCIVAFCVCFFILLQVFAGARFSLLWWSKGVRKGHLEKNVPNTSRRHCEAWALKVVNVLRCCLHCSLCFCFFVLLQVFAGAPFPFA